MTCARLAGPGERFAIFGSDCGYDGRTGTCGEPATSDCALYDEQAARNERKHGPLMFVDIDDYTPPVGAVVAFPRKWLIAIDGDPDVETRDSNEPSTDEVAE